GGNPLFLEQLAARTDAGVGEALPDSLEALVATEIDALSTSDRATLRVGAVLGPIFDASLLLSLIDATSVEQVLSGGLARFLERVGDLSIRFRNQTYRDVAYETLSFGRRRDLHQQALAAIEETLEDTDDEAEVLSYHALHARDFRRCWDYSQTAAKKAQSSYAMVEAAVLFERALTAGTQLPAVDLSETWEALGDVSIKAGMYEKAKRAFDKARALGPHPAGRAAMLCRKEAVTAMHRGQATSITRWINRGLAFVATSTSPEELKVRSDLRLTYGEVLQRRRRNGDAVALADLAGADAVAAGNDAALARALTLRGLALLDLGRINELDCLTDALRLWEEDGSIHDQAIVATVLGAVAYHTGQWDDAVAFFERSGRDFERAGDVSNAGYGIVNMADIVLDQGRGSEVVSDLHEVVRIWRAVGLLYPIPSALINLGRCALERGDIEDALAHFTEARAMRDTAGRVETDYWLAECALRSGDATRTLTLVNELLRVEEAGGGTFLPRLYRLRGLALASLERFDEAITDEETSLRLGQERGAAFEAAQAILALDACHAAIGARVDDALRDEAYATLKRLGVRDVQLPLPG
ncbi:MAG: hypothetical protein Q8K63_11480, partial [Acidimicrobiales bacterium]|nr:hypothetical protein [Acidimicrobiales bacterium]